MWCHVSEGKSDNPFQPVEPGVNVSISKELVSSVSKKRKKIPVLMEQVGMQHRNQLLLSLGQCV